MNRVILLFLLVSICWITGCVERYYPQEDDMKTGTIVINAHLTDQPGHLEIYPPLVMIDGVAIFDIEAVLAVSPRLIERIEIVNAPYIRGNVTFGGIISLISKNNDLGYIDLPSSGLKLDPDESGAIRFHTSDLEGEYEILIRGSDSTGKFLEKRIPFRVEQSVSGYTVK